MSRADRAEREVRSARHLATNEGKRPWIDRPARRDQTSERVVEALAARQSHRSAGVTRTAATQARPGTGGRLFHMRPSRQHSGASFSFAIRAMERGGCSSAQSRGSQSAQRTALGTRGRRDDSAAAKSLEQGRSRSDRGLVGFGRGARGRGTNFEIRRKHEGREGSDIDTTRGILSLPSRHSVTVCHATGRWDKAVLPPRAN